jgi:hypothetical protein
MDVTRDWRSWNRLSSEFGRRVDGLDVTRFVGTRTAPPVTEYAEDLGGADVARDRERGVFDVDNVGARGFVSAGGAKFIGYALRDVLGTVLDGLRGREMLEDIAGSLWTWSAASSSSSNSGLRLRDIKGIKGSRDMTVFET